MKVYMKILGERTLSTSLKVRKILSGISEIDDVSDLGDRIILELNCENNQENFEMIMGIIKRRFQIDLSTELDFSVYKITD